MDTNSYPTSTGEQAPSTAGQEDTRAIASDGAARLEPATQDLIGRQLKTMYSDLVNQEVPEHLLRLLEELQAKETKS